MRNEKHVVIGAGIAGCISAIVRKKAGYDVVIFDNKTSKDPEVYCLCSETSKVVSENHSGSEYPYDNQSALDCFHARVINENFFPDFIYAGKDYSRIIPSVEMSRTDDNIIKRCQDNFNLLKSEYETSIALDPNQKFVFGEPDECFKIDRNISGNVLDADYAFVTPQRGFNPVYVSTLLDWHIKKLDIPVIDSLNILKINLTGEEYEIHTINKEQESGIHHFSQVCIAAGVNSFEFSKMINNELTFPDIYLAQRNISLVKLRESKNTLNFTCLKLEHAYGGMYSPFNNSVAMVYHPPSAHIDICKMDDISCRVPKNISDFMLPENKRYDLAKNSLEKLKKFYPLLEDAEVVTTFNSIAINTVTDSRIRRNMGVFEIKPGCTSVVLAKWTMAVANAFKSLEMSLNYSRYSSDDVTAIMNDIHNFKLEVPEEWKQDITKFYYYAKKHALNLGYPEDAIYPLNISNIKSLKNDIHNIPDCIVGTKM